MNIGELKDRVYILELNHMENTYSWETCTSIWAKVEQLKGNNIFSKVGIGAKSIKFTIRKQKDITLHNAFRWQGRHCFITDIVDIDRMSQEVTAALIEPRMCRIKRTGKPVLNELNRPVYGNAITIIFPGCLTEKYMGLTQGEPMAITEKRYILVVPKIIELSTGEQITIDNIPYTVVIPHTLDEYKNEYEIMVKEDT